MGLCRFFSGSLLLTELGTMDGWRCEEWDQLRSEKWTIHCLGLFMTMGDRGTRDKLVRFTRMGGEAWYWFWGQR